MRHYTKILFVCTILAGLFSCEDDELDFSVKKPESVAVLEYLNQYAPLKSYVDYAASPNFHLGAGANLTEYIGKGPMYRLVNQNFDNITIGYEMKHGAVVQDDGSLDMGNIITLIEMAQAAGLNIYGHTLCWHANQNASYLNSLIAATVIPAEPVETELIANGDFEGGTINGWGGWGNDTPPSISAPGEGYEGGHALKLQNTALKNS
ncbi:MAG: endo-1,4-beta-xylanase [Tannerellaceae bacterium]|nr:endo-1,4-beta-xylanase [Tannerellaceae bacterium]